MKGTNLPSTLTSMFRNIALLTHFLRQRFLVYLFSNFREISKNTAIFKIHIDISTPLTIKNKLNLHFLFHKNILLYLHPHCCICHKNTSPPTDTSDFTNSSPHSHSYQHKLLHHPSIFSQTTFLTHFHILCTTYFASYATPINLTTLEP